MGYKFAPLVFSGLIPSSSGGAVSWRGSVDTEGDLPTVGNTDGDAIVVKATTRIYIWGTGKWNDSGLDEATFGSTPNLNGVALITDNTDPVVRRIKIELEPADATNPGAVSIVAQSFAGDKTFTDNVIVQGTIDAQSGIDSSTGTLDIGAAATSINIGAPGATVTIQGDTIYEQVTDLYVKDKTITINDGGGVASAGDAGIEVEENSVITGYAKVSADRNSWKLKAPNQAGVAVIDAGAAGITLNQSSHDPLTLGAVGVVPNADGATLTGQVLNLEPADATNPGVISTGPQTISGEKTFADTLTASVGFVAQGDIDAQTSIGSSSGTLNLGNINTNLVNIGDSVGATTLSIIHHAPSDYNGNDITNAKSLQLEDPGVGVNKITIQAPTLAGDYTLTLPVDDGINHQFAKTDGSGNISWEFPKNNADIFHASADGRSEYTTVQSAINAAEAAGAAYLSPKFVIVHGEFTEDLTISKSGVFLIGETSQENLFNRINGSLTINKLVNIPGEGATIALIYVGGLTFTKASDNFIQFTGTNHQRVKFDGCTLISTANSVLLCNNTGVGSKVTVRNCSIQTSGAAKKAITMSNGWIDIRNSIVENTASGGVAISGADSVLATLSNTEVGGQISSTIAATFVISTSSITTASGSAIATTSASYVAISNSGLSVPFGTNSVTGTGAFYFADIVNGGLGGGFASTVAAVGFINDVGNLRFPNRGTISLTESLANGQNSTTLQAASSIASNFTYTLPDAVPSNNNSAIVSSITGALSYVYVTASSAGDISKTNTTALDNQAVAQNVAGLSFTPGITNSFDVQMYIVRDSTYAEYNIRGVYKTASLTWEMSQEYIGDDTGIIFTITAEGQVRYTSTSTGFNATLYYRALTV